MTASKNIGTRAETAVVKYLHNNGFGLAERRALRGARDVGDLLLCPGLIAEVKAGEKAKTFQQKLLADWQKQTMNERVNAGADVAVLVVQRRGYGALNADKWWAWITPEPALASGQTLQQAWMPLASALTLLRADGWGDPVDNPCP